MAIIKPHHYGACVQQDASGAHKVVELWTGHLYRPDERTAHSMLLLWLTGYLNLGRLLQWFTEKLLWIRIIIICIHCGALITCWLFMPFWISLRRLDTLLIVNQKVFSKTYARLACMANFLIALSAWSLTKKFSLLTVCITFVTACRRHWLNKLNNSVL